MCLLKIISHYLQQTTNNLTMISIQDRKAFSGKRASEALTSNFKSSSRQKKAPWGHRFIKDHNDLLYDADPNSISSRLKQSAKPRKQTHHNQLQNSPLNKFQYSPVRQRQIAKTSQSQRNIHKGLNVDNFIASVQEMERMKRTCQETAATSSKKTRFIDERDNVQVEPFNDYEVKRRTKRNFIEQNIHEIAEYKVEPAQQKANLLGLSKYEFQTTIQGKLLSKSNHHIDFNRSKTNKINNVHKPWYNHSKDIDKSQDLLEKEKIYSLKRIHSFKSDSGHKLFHRTRRMLDDNGCGNGGLHPQQYDINSPEKYNMNHERIAKDVVNYRTMSARPDHPKKLGTNLFYKVQQINALGAGDHKRPVLTLSHSQRKLVFSRQVISPSRGCFR